jgi:hypothetical protein
MSVRMLEDRELSSLVTFAARHDLLALSAGGRRIGCTR